MIQNRIHTYDGIQHEDKRDDGKANLFALRMRPYPTPRATHELT